VPSVGVPVQYADLARRLGGAEDRLFPIAMVDPDRYRHSVSLVAALARRLTDAATTWEQLAAAASALRAALPATAAEQGIPLVGLDPELVVDAALAQRLRALLVEQSESARRRAMDRARDAGQTWAILAEPDPATTAFGVAQWEDVHLASGALMVRSSRPGPDGKPVYRMQLRTYSGLAMDEEYTDLQAWSAAVQRARSRAESDAASDE
jgi:hypothetical protein